MSDKYRIEDGDGFKLESIDPDDTGDFKSRDECELETRKDIQTLRTLSDDTIKHVFSGINPVACQVTSFKAPTPEELEHHFLWRISKALPPRGNFGIFNRSHYEDVLIVRVHDLVPKSIWKQRYDHINDFERLLTEEGTLVIKFFLYISKDEQKERLQERLDKPEKHWKFDLADLEERKLWDEYIEAYEAMIRKCSAPWAPWYVVPANKKWYRNYVVANALVKTLSKLDLTWPKAKFDPKKVKIV
jgi:PPK2 family polyphosphate:nucleotide phosphotransferase